MDQDVQGARVVVETGLVDQERAATLHRVIAALQRRWGHRALRLFGETSPNASIPVLSTGFPDLDAALGSGGLPRGRITEVLGRPTSGATTIVLRTLAQAQAAGDRVGYIDMRTTFDAEYAVWCGVRLDTLLLVRPRQPIEALDILYALVASHGLGMLVVDDMALLQDTPQSVAALSTALRVFAPKLASSPCALVVLTALPFRPAHIRTLGVSGSALAHAASLRLHVGQEDWLDDEHLPLSCRVRVRVLKSKFGALDATATVTLEFADTWSVS